MEHLLAVGQYVQGHVLGIVLSIVATYVVGFIWHGPLFGKLWMKYNKMTPPKKGEMKFSMMLPGLSASLVQTFVQAAVMGRSFEILYLPSVGHALLIATLLWLPFTGLVIVNSYAWEGKRVGHMCLTAGYYLVTTWAIAAVLYTTL